MSSFAPIHCARSTLAAVSYLMAAFQTFEANALGATGSSQEAATANAAAEDVTLPPLFYVKRNGFLGDIRCSVIPTGFSTSSPIGLCIQGISRGCLHPLLRPALSSCRMPLVMPEGIYPSASASETHSKEEGQQMNPCPAPRSSAGASSLHPRVTRFHASTSRDTPTASTVSPGARARPTLAGQSGYLRVIGCSERNSLNGVPRPPYSAEYQVGELGGGIQVASVVYACFKLAQKMGNSNALSEEYGSFIFGSLRFPALTAGLQESPLSTPVLALTPLRPIIYHKLTLFAIQVQFQFSQKGSPTHGRAHPSWRSDPRSHRCRLMLRTTPRVLPVIGRWFDSGSEDQNVTSETTTAAVLQLGGLYIP
ncbi:hypothetical protein T4B_2868 [Trichinella pseudospiralis]|uniref:Uncharacterized protein n=1 Tax=Trichinella pseudospiralis TaxID=6337 RepID=A0A0V1IBN3_TRIPS|nr:hypothetical protein T4B_2868 [Trichinella pseudospiralis]KRZ30986.1 hypothetical protein T4C_387 [Trichinella pseudospiralis]